MKCTQFYPVILTDDVAGTARFYQDNFRFDPAFESDWYIHLQSSEDKSVNIAVLLADHETVPRGRARAGFGPHHQFRGGGCGSESSSAPKRTACLSCWQLRDEPFGQRHFITHDPNGVLIDVIKPIPPSEEFLNQYTDDAVPT